ncbi:MAG TPA: YIP1 family protein [Thermohalobaculum sp.]|nr:YIP1 family protein [Thermohalobaculum sp.]
MEQALREGGLVWRVLTAWTDLRGALRAELDRGPTEGRLLFYAMLSGLIWFLGRAALVAWGPLAPIYPPDEFRARLAAELVSSVFFRTLALYALAALAGAIARAAGGTGGWRDSRAALFWAALVAAPAILAAHLLSVLLTGVPGQAGAIAGMLGALAFGWVAAQCIAEAHGFRSALRVLAVMAALVAAFIGALYLTGRML